MKDSEKMEDALNEIINWADAYPVDVFIEPTPEIMKRANEVLKAAGISFTAINAHTMRHVIEGVRGIAEKGLSSTD